MLHGDVIELRLVRERDLSTLYELLTNLESRGSYFPLGVMSEPVLRVAFDKNGFWDDDEGMLIMTTGDGDIVGEIEYFPITHYLQGYEISYQLFGDHHAGVACADVGFTKAATTTSRSGRSCDTKPTPPDYLLRRSARSDYPRHAGPS